MNRRTFLASLPVIAAAPSVLKAAAVPVAPTLTVGEILQDSLDEMRLAIEPMHGLQIISPDGVKHRLSIDENGLFKREVIP